MKHSLYAIFALLSAFLLTGCEKAERGMQWPARPIKVIVPFAAGGGSDTFARQLIRVIDSKKLFDQPMVVINVGGAGGTIGSRRVKNARPDGYTMLMLHEGLLTARHAGRAPYGPEAFEAVAATGRVDMVAAVAENSPWQNLDQLMSDASEKRERLRFAANIGAPSHFGGLMLESTKPGTAFRFVQYGGGADRFAAITGGHVDLSIFSVEEYLRYQEGGLRALAVFSAERHPALADIPTGRELGYDVILSNMHFWWMPKGAPSDAREMVADVIEKAMSTDEMKDIMAKSWTEPVMLRGDALLAELEEREESMSRVSLRQLELLPNFPAWIGMATVLLTVLAVAKYLRFTRKEKVGRKASSQVWSRLSLACYFLTCLYVLVLSLGWLTYPAATAIYLFVMGGLIASWKKQVLLPLAGMALILAFGLFYLFTRVLVVDLPG